MGPFGPSKKDRAAAAEKWETLAAQEAKKAREEARKAAAYKKSLESGKSQDPAADRYMLAEVEGNRRIAEANARDCRETAKTLRKRWF